MSGGSAHAAQQGVAADHQQLGSIDLGCRPAAYFGGRVAPGQRCCWPLDADPFGFAVRGLTAKLLSCRRDAD